MNESYSVKPRRASSYSEFIDSEELKERTRQEAQRFLAALEKNMNVLIEMASRVEEQATQYDVSAYDDFREELHNFRSLSILIESRLSEISGERKVERLQEQFDQLQALMLSTFIRTCMKTFFVYSAKTMMSLGTKERFLRDLSFLQEAEERLREEAMQSRLDHTTLDDLETAKEVLHEIIEKAPEIINFAVEHAP